MATLPAGLLDRNYEFFSYKGEVYMLSGGKMTGFRHFPHHIIQAMQDDLHAHPDALFALQQMGLTRPMAQLEKWISCRYGNFDYIPDLDHAGETTSEIPQCPELGTCLYLGIICDLSCPGESRLSLREIEVIRTLSEDIPNKQIGDRLNISPFTVNAHIRNIQAKTGCHTKVGIVRWAAEHNIL